jgi:hypothetical protein
MRINEIVSVVFDEENRHNFIAKIVKHLSDGQTIVEGYDKYYNCWFEETVSKENLKKIN